MAKFCRHGFEYSQVKIINDKFDGAIIMMVSQCAAMCPQPVHQAHPFDLMMLRDRVNEALWQERSNVNV